MPEGALSDCTRLSRLSIHLNKLGPTVPADLGSLSHLEALSLFGNEISKLPGELFSKGKLTKLARLPLWDNKLKELPNGWATRGGMEALQELWLSRNDLENLEFFDDGDGDDDDDDDGGGGEKKKKNKKDPVLPSLTRLWIDGNGRLDAEKVIAEAARACPALQEVHADCARCRGGGGGGSSGGSGGGGGKGGGNGGGGGACTRRRADGWKCTAAISAGAAAPAPDAPAAPA